MTLLPLKIVPTPLTTISILKFIRKVHQENEQTKLKKQIIKKIRQQETAVIFVAPTNAG